jgi:hypothetical protein
MESHAPNQAQKEGQIAETVADDARPCALCALFATKEGATPEIAMRMVSQRLG